MKTKLNATQRVGVVIGLAILLFVPAGQAAYVNSILIDFGNNSSYHGATVVNPGVSNAYWNSLDWGPAGGLVTYNNLLYSNNVASTIDIVFSNVAPAVGWGMGDSYNGPAGTTYNYLNSDVNGTVLGVMGQLAAVYEYYINGRVTLQECSASTYYKLTFFGSHKYNTDNITVYRVFTNNWGATAYVAAYSNSLTVGVNANHNRDQVAIITNVVPQADNTIMVSFKGANGNFGYLNCMKIEEFVVPEPAVLISGLLAGLVLAGRQRRS